MKRFASLFAAALVLALGLSTAQAVNTRYFDVNDNATGSGVQNQAGYAWNSTDLSWNPNADGGGAGPGTTVAWVNGDNAVFSAGTDAASKTYSVNIAAGVTAASAFIDHGTVQVTGGVLDTGTGTLTVGFPGGLGVEGLKIASSTQLNSAGKLVLDQGTLIQTDSATTGDPLISATKSLEVTANGGTLSYQSTYIGTSPNFSTGLIIYNPSTGAVLGTGGTTTNGGVGTLTIDAEDEPGAGYSEIRFQGTSMANNTYAKLNVVHGMFRMGSSGTNTELTLGAAPTAVLPDAITLNGGFISASWSPTLNANRGITIGPNGGGFDNGGGRFNPTAGGGVITLPGPLSGSGEFIVKGISNSNGNRGGGITLSNAGNVNTFTGGLTVQGSSLTLNESLTVTHLQGDHTHTVPPVGIVPTTPEGLINIASGKTLTFGSDNTDTAWDGQTSGSGSMTKVGTGTITLNSLAKWGNTGGTNINSGTIKYATSAAGLSGPVTIGATGKLNMNGINDTFASLAGPAGAIVDMKDTAATAGNLTLNGATPVNTTYSGTIVGGGNFIKSSNSTQKFGGNTSFGTVALAGGFTLVNGPSTMTAAGGISIAAAGSLGGTGIVVGAVTNDGVIAPGDGGIGTLSLTGNVTETAIAIWRNEISGTTTDKLAVTGNIDLSATGDTLSVTGPGTGSSWVIASYTGTLSGIFNNVTAGFTVDYGTGTNSVITLNAVPVGVPGDFNGDNKVDASDYVSLRKLNSDITTGVGLTNYNTWRTNYGTNAGSGSGLSGGAVPEPTSIALLVSSLGFVFAGRHRTR